MIPLDAPLATALQDLDGWTLEAERPCIAKAWRFDSFEAAVAFFNAVAELAQAHDHHPEVLNCYTRLQVRLWTHESSGLTHKDFALARAIDQLAGTAGPTAAPTA